MITPTLISGVPVRDLAVLAIPTRFPVTSPVTLPVKLPENPLVAVTTPETLMFDGSFALSIVGSLSLLRVPRLTLDALRIVIPDPNPTKDVADTIPEDVIFPVVELIPTPSFPVRGLPPNLDQHQRQPIVMLGG